MRRRQFLKWALPVSTAAMAGASLTFPGIASASNGKRLIIIFQRGGCDGLNSVVPYGDDNYYNLRPTIAISPPGTGGSGSAVSIGSDLLALHPSLAPLANIYLQGDMAIMPSVHFPEAPRSHFASQAHIELGFSNQQDDGWMNRYLQLHQGGGELPAVGIGSFLAGSLRGPIAVPSFNQFNNTNWIGEPLLDSIRTLYQDDVDPGDANRSAIHANGQLMLDNREAFSSLSEQQYTPANGAVYPDSRFGAHLQQLAQIIKSGMGLEVAAVDSHGWDTHREQGGASGIQAARLTEFAEGLAAFYSDLGPAYMQDTLILTMTEFGRTAKENASGGTDHGHASAWYAIGGNVNGGIYGAWPGLAEQNLHDGRYLAQAVDCRDVICESVALHLGQGFSLDTIIPGHAPQPLGFL